MARATCLIAGASSTAPDSGVCFPSEFFITTGAFTPGQVLNFGTLAYIADCYSELWLLDGAMPVSNEFPASPPLPGHLGADREGLAQ